MPSQDQVMRRVPPVNLALDQDLGQGRPRPSQGLTRARPSMLESLQYAYLNPDSPAYLAGVEEVLRQARKTKSGASIQRQHVREFLAKQETYQLHKQTRKTRRNKVIPTGLHSDHQADLCDMRQFADQNLGFGWILTIIDVLSRQATAVPLKSKSGPDVLAGFKQAYKHFRIPWSLFTE